MVPPVIISQSVFNQPNGLIEEYSRWRDGGVHRFSFVKADLASAAAEGLTCQQSRPRVRF